jgi:hypothetical protein
MVCFMDDEDSDSHGAYGCDAGTSAARTLHAFCLREVEMQMKAPGTIAPRYLGKTFVAWTAQLTTDGCVLPVSRHSG